MILNNLMLFGTVCKRPIQKISPSGIPHCQFVLEHRSDQVEAGCSRRAWCRIPVVVSGKSHQAITQSIRIGVQVTVQGFISCHKGRNGLNKIVVHAEQIELISSGGD